MTAPRPRIVVAMTGASGAVYAVRLLDVLLAAGVEVHLTISPSGAAVLKQELDLEVDLQRVTRDELVPPADVYRTAPCFARLRRQLDGAPPATHAAESDGVLKYHHYQDFFSPIAGGSFLTSAMVVAPCSGGTLSGIAHGTSANLIQRAAEVHLKERRRLVLVPRETPLSLIALDNMCRAVEAGATVLPAMPGWYHGVDGLGDLVDFVVGRIVDQLGLPNELVPRWGEP